MIKTEKDRVKAEILSAPFYNKPYLYALLVELIMKHEKG